VSLITLNPDVALLLITGGVLAICVEFLRPGTIMPGAFGSVSLLFGFAALPQIRWQGVLILIMAFALLALESIYPSRHLLTAAGTLTLPLGAVMMQPRIHPVIALMTMVPLALIAGYLFRLAVRAHRNKSL
jgi:membrane-bound serine protease (ClpP class)